MNSKDKIANTGKPMSNLRTLFELQKTIFLTDKTQSYEWRIEQLDRLKKMLTENQQALKDALSQDFKTAWFELRAAFLAFFASLPRSSTGVSRSGSLF